MQYPRSLTETASTLTTKVLLDGQGSGLAAPGAAEDAGRLGRGLPRLRARAALFRGVGGGAPHRVPAVRRRDARALPRLRRPVLVGVCRRLRSLRRVPPPAGAVRHPHPQALRAWPFEPCLGSDPGRVPMGHVRLMVTAVRLRPCPDGPCPREPCPGSDPGRVPIRRVRGRQAEPGQPRRIWEKRITVTVSSWVTSRL